MTMDVELKNSETSGNRSRQLPNALTNAWYEAQIVPCRIICSFQLHTIHFPADMPQKESDALQEKIAALVAEQSARQGSLPN